MSDWELAGRGRRVIAAILDIILVFVFGLLLMMATGALDDADDYAGNWPFVIIPILGLSSYVILNGLRLFMKGQTLSQWLMGIKAVDQRGDVPSIFRLIVRGLCFMCIYAAPSPVGIFVVVDLAMGFGRERRCLHDRITGTSVVVVQAVEGTPQSR